jgi:hypothetical protein
MFELFNTVKNIFGYPNQNTLITQQSNDTTLDLPIIHTGGSKYKKTLRNKRYTKQNKPNAIRKTRVVSKKRTKKSKS